MTERESKWSIAIAASGAGCVAGAAAWGLPGPVALATVGTLLILVSIGARHVLGVLLEGFKGYEEESEEEEVEVV